MAKLQEAENQIVIDYEIYDRRPSDSDLLIAARRPSNLGSRMGLQAAIVKVNLNC